MPNVSLALNTMLDSLLSDLVMGQPAKHVQREGLALAATKLTGGSLRNTTVVAGTMRLLMDTTRENGVDTDPHALVDVRVGVVSFFFRWDEVSFFLAAKRLIIVKIVVSGNYLLSQLDVLQH